MKKNHRKDPTVRDIRRCLREITGSSSYDYCDAFNDKRSGNFRLACRRIKFWYVEIPHIVLHSLKFRLEKEFPAHQFALGHIRDPWGKYASTVIHIQRDNRKYDELFPPKTRLTIDEMIAELAGCRPEDVEIVK